MAMSILSEKKSDVVLCSHRGMSPADIVQDCLEKMRALLQMGACGFDLSSLPRASQHQYLSLLDDLADVALGHFLFDQEVCRDE